MCMMDVHYNGNLINVNIFIKVIPKQNVGITKDLLI